MAYLSINDYDLNCDSADGVWAPDAYLYALAIALWLYYICLFLFTILIFNPRSDYTKPSAWEVRYLWMAWLGFCCWNPFSQRERSMQRTRAKRIGLNLCALFGHVDMTWTDVWASFVVERMLYEREKRAKERASAARMHEHKRSDGGDGATSSTAKSYVEGGGRGDRAGDEVDRELQAPTEQHMHQHDTDTSIGDGFDGNTNSKPTIKPTALPPVDHMTMQEASHYFQFALATYGWMLYVFDHGIKGLLSICFGRLSPFNLRQRSVPLNTKIAKATLPPTCDILFLREEGTIPDVLCYFIALDHATKSVVVTVRGALALMDNVRDLLFEAADLTPWLATPWSWNAEETPSMRFPESAATVHHDNSNNTLMPLPMAQADYLHVAAKTLKDILRQGVLQTALSTHPDYTLVLTGHSLGAAIAYLMGLRVRREVTSLKCWAFSPPMGLASAFLGASSTSWCTAVMCGKELPPRYAVDTLDRALSDMLEAGARCKRPKLRVLAQWIWGMQSDDDVELTPSRHHHQGKRGGDELAWSTYEQVPQEVKDVLGAARDKSQNDQYRRQLLNTAGTFGLPHKLIHLQLVEKRGGGGWQPACCGCCCCACCVGGPAERVYEGRWVDADQVKREGLIPSGRVLSDHMPDFIGHVLQDATAAAAAAAQRRDDVELGG